MKAWPTLCLDQRKVYYVAIPLALIVALAASRGASRPLVVGGLALLAVVMLCGAALAVYHSGVEWKFWPGPQDCTGDIGNFGKLFSEAIEAADRKPREGIVSTGGSAILGIRFGILPEVFPVLASQVLYFFESNTRSATIIGIVGAGGIGVELKGRFDTFDFGHVSTIILVIFATVVLLEQLSQRVRGRLIAVG